VGVLMGGTTWVLGGGVRVAFQAKPTKIVITFKITK